MFNNFDLEKYRIDNPMDYIKAIKLINEDPHNAEISDTIYKITRLHVPDKIFKYYSLTDNMSLNDQKFKTLANKKIYLADAVSLNDPFDGKAFFYNAEKLLIFDRLKHCDGKLIDDFSTLIRVASFTINGINNMPMWAHYSNNHSGYCLEFSTQTKENLRLRSSLFPVQYIDERLDITNIMISFITEVLQLIEDTKQSENKSILINNLIILWIGIYFSCIKHLSWNYENEYRFITSSDNEPFINASPSAIYVGAKCSAKNIKKLCEIASELNVPIFMMHIDEYSSKYELTPEKIDF